MTVVLLLYDCIQMKYRRGVWSLNVSDKKIHTPNFFFIGLSKDEIEEALRVSGTATDEVIMLNANLFILVSFCLASVKAKLFKFFWRTLSFVL